MSTSALLVIRGHFYILQEENTGNRFKISANTYHSKLDIKDLNGNYLNGVNDLFSIVLILKELLNKYEFKQFYNSLIKNIAKLKKKINSDSYAYALYKMGFPKRYKKLLKM